MLSALSAASLMAPALLAAELVRGAVDDGWSIVVGCSVLFLLVVVRMAQLNRQMERHAARVRQLSREDELTGLPNRRAWNEELPRALEHARLTGQPIAVAMIDLDHFKRFNDTHGHLAGDDLLSSAATAWRAELRSDDVLARYGGEEFIALLPGTAPGEAEEVLTRLLAATPLGQTFSCGVAHWNGTETADQLVGRADATLYEAKSAGRNRVRSALQPVP
jgi:diguanylate cyclase (GGDEF)-like protein